MTIYCYLITLCLPPTIKITYVLITCILWGMCSDYTMLACQPAGKMSYKNMFRIVRYCYWPYDIWMCSWHVSWACYWFYTYANLSGFLIIHLDLVLMIPLSSEIALLFIGAFVFSCLCSLSLPFYAPHLMPLLFACDLGAVHMAHFDYCCCFSACWHVLFGFYWYCLICLQVGQFLCDAVLWLLIVDMCLLWLMWVLCIVFCMWYICHLM